MVLLPQIVPFCLSLSGAVIVVGAILTIRKYIRISAQKNVQHSYTTSPILCAYCGLPTIDFIRFMRNGRTYQPMCYHCQLQMDIRDPDGMIRGEYFYQVEQQKGEVWTY
jgi:hypothetical protein